jgi:hypothetical protein
MTAQVIARKMTMMRKAKKIRKKELQQLIWKLPHSMSSGVGTFYDFINNFYPRKRNFSSGLSTQQQQTPRIQLCEQVSKR